MRALQATPDDGDHQRDRDRRSSRRDRERLVEADGRTDGNEHEREREQRRRPEEDRAQRPAQVGAGLGLASLGEAGGDAARGRGLESERGDGADQDDGEEGGEQRILPPFEDSRESELEDGVERVRRPDGEREQEARPDQRPPSLSPLRCRIGAHRHVLSLGSASVGLLNPSCGPPPDECSSRHLPRTGLPGGPRMPNPGA